MKSTRRLSGMLVAGWLLLESGAGVGLAQATDAADGAARARALVERALRAIGDDVAMRNLTGLRLAGSGARYWVGQGDGPQDARRILPLSIEWIVDVEQERIFRSQVLYQGDLPYFSITSRVSRERGVHLEDVTKVRFPVPAPSAERLRAAWLHRFPEPRGRLLDALNASSLRYVGQRDSRGQTVEVVSAAIDSAQTWVLYFDVEKGLLRRAERGEPTELPLDTVARAFDYDDYRPVSGLMIAFHVRETTPRVGTVGAVTVDDVQFTEVVVDPRVEDADFADVDGVPRRPDGEIATTEVAPGVYFVENARPNYNQLVVDLPEGLLVVDAPFNDQVAQAVLARLEEILPARPVRYVVPTHFHYDHIGGLPTYVGLGAQVLTTPGNIEFFDDLILRSFRFQGRTPPDAGIAAIRDRLRLGGERQPVELHLIRAQPHVDEMLLVYLPHHKMLYVADVVSADWGRVRPAIPETFTFERELERLGLEVETILPSHGPAIRWQEFQRALADGRAMSERGWDPSSVKDTPEPGGRR